MNESNNNNTQAALEAGMELGEIRYVGDLPFVVLPEGAKTEELENLLLTPTRKRGLVTLRDVGSFIALVNKEETPATRLYGNVNPPNFTAVFNDHADGSLAGWRDYRAAYACPLSIEWKTWAGMSGKQMSQADFAAFIENNLPDIVNPLAAHMLEISRTLEAKKKVNFASAIRLDNGQNQFTYEEEISGTAQKGQLQIPEEFTIGIPVLEGGAPYAVDARLRYRIADGGKLTMWFELIRPHKVVENAAAEVWSQIEAETELKVFNGGI